MADTDKAAARNDEAALAAAAATVAAETDDDTQQLHKLGYEQSLRRVMAPIATLFFVCSNMSFYSIQSYIFGQGAFGNGGAPAVIWGWVVVGFFALIVSACLAEISSVFPTAGGPFYWAGALTAKGGSKLPAYMAGLFQLLAWIPGCASVTVFGVTTMCNVLRSLHGDNPALFTQSQVTGIAVGFSFLSFLINSAPSKYFGWLTYVTATNLIIGLLATIIVLPSVSPKQRRAADVFGNFVSNAHNTPAAALDYDANPANSDGWTFCMALLPASFIISGFESPSHVSEETRNARRAVPRAIFGSVVLTVVGGLCLLLAMMFSVQDPTFSTTISPTGQTWEYATLYFDVFENWKPNHGKAGATFFMALLLIADFAVMVFSHTSAVRTVYAMARDGALPFSDALSRTTSWGMPIAANAAAFVAEVGFILLNLNHQPEVAWSGATVAFNASTAYSIMGYYLSYFVPILLRHTSARSTFVPTPDFSLGRASLPMACISLVWIVFIVLVSMWQQGFPINKNSLNWTAPGFGIGLFATSAYWILHARFSFRGPKRPDDDSLAGGWANAEAARAAQAAEAESSPA